MVQTNQKAREEEPKMIIIGADYHPAFQQIAFVDTETGELNELRLEEPRGGGEVLSGSGGAGMKVRVGMEASGHARWFERLLAELHFELWMGDAALDTADIVRDAIFDSNL